VIRLHGGRPKLKRSGILSEHGIAGVTVWPAGASNAACLGD